MHIQISDLIFLLIAALIGGMAIAGIAPLKISLALKWFRQHAVEFGIFAIVLIIIAAFFYLADYISKEPSFSFHGDIKMAIWAMPNGMGAFLGAILGFLAATGVAYYNVNHARRKEEESKRDEAKSLLMAFYCEIRDIEKSTSSLIKKIIDKKGVQTTEKIRRVRNLSMPKLHIISRNMDKIGKIEELHARKITHFHQYYTSVMNTIENKDSQISFEWLHRNLQFIVDKSRDAIETIEKTGYAPTEE